MLTFSIWKDVRTYFTFSTPIECACIAYLFCLSSILHNPFTIIIMTSMEKSTLVEWQLWYCFTKTYTVYLVVIKDLYVLYFFIYGKAEQYKWIINEWTFHLYFDNTIHKSNSESSANFFQVFSFLILQNARNQIKTER